MQGRQPPGLVFVAVLAVGLALSWTVVMVSYWLWDSNRAVSQAIILGYAMLLVAGFISAREWPHVNVPRLMLYLALALLIVLARLPWWAFIICLVAIAFMSDFAPGPFRRRQPPR